MCVSSIRKKFRFWLLLVLANDDSLCNYQFLCSETSQYSLSHSFCDYALSDPVLIIITLAAVVGSFCLLSGLILLCAVSKTLHDQTSEAILLLGIGFFIYTIAFVTWKITNVRRIAHVIQALNKEIATSQV